MIAALELLVCSRASIASTPRSRFTYDLGEVHL